MRQGPSRPPLTSVTWAGRGRVEWGAGEENGEGEGAGRQGGRLPGGQERLDRSVVTGNTEEGNLRPGRPVPCSCTLFSACPSAAKWKGPCSLEGEGQAGGQVEARLAERGFSQALLSASDTLPPFPESSPTRKLLVWPCQLSFGKQTLRLQDHWCRQACTPRSSRPRGKAQMGASPPPHCPQGLKLLFFRLSLFT